MTDPGQLRKWSAHYAAQRAAGEAGWAGADGYAWKWAALETALRENGVPVGAAFLELGCGAGNIALRMAEKGYTAAGVDCSPAAVAWARERAAAAGVDCRFECADLSDLTGFGEMRFAVAYDGDCLQMIPDDALSACLTEVRRLLRPGGFLVAGGNMRPAGGESGALRLLTPDGFVYWLRDEAGLTAALERAGFVIRRVTRLPRRGAHPAFSHAALIYAGRSV